MRKNKKIILKIIKNVAIATGGTAIELLKPMTPCDLQTDLLGKQQDSKWLFFKSCSVYLLESVKITTSTRLKNIHGEENLREPYHWDAIHPVK